MLLLQLPGSNLISSQGLASILLLQLCGQSKKLIVASSHTAVAMTLEWLIESQRFSSVKLLQLPGSKLIRNHGLASMLLLQLLGSNLIISKCLASMLLLQLK